MEYVSPALLGEEALLMTDPASPVYFSTPGLLQTALKFLLTGT